MRKMDIKRKEPIDSEDSASELTELIINAKNGSSAAFEELKRRYTPLLESQVLKHTIADMMPQDVDDLKQEAFVIFCNAVCNFDCDSKGVEFGLYAKICIENGLSSFVRSFIRRRNRVVLPLESAEQLPDMASIDLLQALIDKQHTEDLVRTVRNNLSDYENRVWWMYVSGRSVSEIASDIGNVDAKSVSNAVYRIRKKLRAIIVSPNNSE